ncbi:hypothetical protein HHI36_000024 [Cryptolaemus montrouzieri]|uniref:Cytochrome c oxidase subunit 4 n=1 Tax=Cryptolaemus montrouzieri TaxID=559131 RepID=A0ABD2P438_9CUCU
MSKLLLCTLKKPILNHFKALCISATNSTHWTIQQAGNREQVGYGWNGLPVYNDKFDYPFPAVRWKEPTPELCCLWEKEKGDWGKLTRAEKKELYRASFRQTFAEMTAPTVQWKLVVGMSCWLLALSMWCYYLIQLYAYPPLPITFCKPYREAQARRMIDLHVNPVEGISSRWDYERNCWK